MKVWAHFREQSSISLRWELALQDIHANLRKEKLSPRHLSYLGRVKPTALGTSIDRLIFLSSLSSSGKGALCKSSVSEQGPWQGWDPSSVLRVDEEPWQKKTISPSTRWITEKWVRRPRERQFNKPPHWQNERCLCAAQREENVVMRSVSAIFCCNLISQCDRLVD